MKLWHFITFFLILSFLYLLSIRDHKMMEKWDKMSDQQRETLRNEAFKLKLN